LINNILQQKVQPRNPKFYPVPFHLGNIEIPFSFKLQNAYSSKIMSPSATANIRVLVRVRPHNNAELNDRGPTGRSNVLTLNTKANGQIDFSNSESKESSADTITVNNTSASPNNEDNNSSSLGNTMRRMTTGYASDSDNGVAGAAASNNKQFTFDAVHGTRSTQDEVYESVHGIVDSVVDGYNGTIVAYGQTGSGKTFTVFGGENGNDEASCGLIQRALRDIFHKITLSKAKEATSTYEIDDPVSSASNSKTTFRGSFFEIFNERVYDLLSPHDSLETSLSVREDVSGVYVEGLKEIQVHNNVEAEALLAKGLANRHVASTNMNRVSSRSHAVFVLSVKSEHVTSDGLRKVRNSKFTLVDLAGSERQKSTAAYGNRLKEASMINKSLLCLGHVINALVDKEAGKARHVPFRNSKLTFLLRDTWGGNSKTCLVATVSPSGSAISETISTLKFAQRAKLIKNNAVLNEDTCGTVAALQAEVAKLRSKLLENTTTNTNTSAATTSMHHNHKIEKFEQDRIDAMKRRAERAENKIAELEKQVSEQYEISNSLKRKVQEETMVRKFKERRLDYLQTNKRSRSNEEDQIRVLHEEIASLQKRLETPTPETIEWRVAYEQAQEEIQKLQRNTSIEEYGESDKKISDLEETIERLCEEKSDLETRLSDLMSSTEGTREEINSMINEVDRLDNAMISQEEQLEAEKRHSNKLLDRVNEAETKIVHFDTTLSREMEEKSKLVNEVDELKTKLESLASDLGEKQSALLELETLSRENELELQCNIEELEMKLQQEKATIEKRETQENDLQNLLTESSNENSKISSELHQAMVDIENQRSAISSLEDKMKALVGERDSAAMLAKQYEEQELHLVQRLDSMSSTLKDIESEKEILESRLRCVKEQAELTETGLEEKTKTVHSLQDEIINLKDKHTESENSWKLVEQTLERELIECKAAIETLNGKIEDLKQSQEVAVESSDKNVLVVTKQLEEEIRKQRDIEVLLEDSRRLNEQSQAEIRELKNSVSITENNIELLKKEKEAAINNALKEKLEIGKHLQEKVDFLEVDNSKSLKNIENMEKQLEKYTIDMDEAIGKIGIKENEISSLREQIAALQTENSSLLKDINARTVELKEHQKEKQKIENAVETSNLSLARKEDEITKYLTERDTALNTLREIQSSHAMYDESKAEEVRRILHEKDVLQRELHDWKTKVEIFSINKVHLKELETKNNNLQLALEKMEEETKEKLEILQSQFKDKEEVAKTIKEKFELIIHEKDIELSSLDHRIKATQSECTRLSTQQTTLEKESEETKKKTLVQQDRIKLLQREKANNQYELDTLREDQNTLNDQLRVMAKENKSLEVENHHLKKVIEDMKMHDLSVNSHSIVSRCSTFENDSNISFDNLTTEMDSMLEKMSTKESVDEASPMEESFLDESLFLPNIEDSDKGILPNMEDSNKENNQPFSTPLKPEYGIKRQPLSERKQNKTPLRSSSKRLQNKTPLQSNSKRLLSSAKKLMPSSSKRNRSSYMVFDNNKLFDKN